MGEDCMREEGAKARALGWPEQGFKANCKLSGHGFKVCRAPVGEIGAAALAGRGLATLSFADGGWRVGQMCGRENLFTQQIFIGHPQRARPIIGPGGLEPCSQGAATLEGGDSQ